MLLRRDFLRLLAGAGAYLCSNNVFAEGLISHRRKIVYPDNLRLALFISKNIEKKKYKAELISKVAKAFYRIGERRLSDNLVHNTMKKLSVKGNNYTLRIVAEYYLETNRVEKALRIISEMSSEIYNGYVDKCIVALKASFYAFSRGDLNLSDHFLYMVPYSDEYGLPLDFEWAFNSVNENFLRWFEKVHCMCNDTSNSAFLATSFFKKGDTVKGLKYLEEFFSFSPLCAAKIALEHLSEKELVSFERKVLELHDELLKQEILFLLAENYIKRKNSRVLMIINKYKEINDKDWALETDVKIGGLFISAGRHDEGRKYLTTALDLAFEKYKTWHPEDQMYIFSELLELLIVEYIKAGLLNETSTLFYKVKTKGINLYKPLRYSGFVEMVKNEDYKDKAICFLKSEVKRVSNNNLIDKINALSEIGCILLDIGETEMAIKIIRDVIKYVTILFSDRQVRKLTDEIPFSTLPCIEYGDDDIMLRSFGYLLTGIARDGLVREAGIFANMLDDQELTEHAYFGLARNLTRTGNFQEALRITNEIRDQMRRDNILFEVGKGLIEQHCNNSKGGES